MTRLDTIVMPIDTVAPAPAERTLKDALADLFEMLRYKRPHNSKSERRWINRFIRPLGCKEDDYGNLYLVVGEEPKILWSCHTDTVHRTHGQQNLLVDTTASPPMLSVHKGECLGADDGAGCWLLREMIMGGVPGLYVFHRNEEHGGVGSKHFVENNGWLLTGIQAAIAFDRKATHSVITHQMTGRCCSDAFGLSVAKVLGMAHALDDGGSFTDTAFYTHIVPECTNISIGYYGEHSSKECLDLDYVADLRDACLTADWTNLVIERNPDEPADPFDRWGMGSGWQWDQDDTIRLHRYEPAGDWRDDQGQLSLFEMCREYPDEVADYLEQMGVDPRTLARHIDAVTSPFGKEWKP